MEAPNAGDVGQNWRLLDK